MANGDDEEDYMSDVFLDQSAQVKPGLLTKTQKRKFKHDTAQKGSKKRKLEDQKRQEGLATPISQGNKGFALLEKMGYKQGSGIGKSVAGETALIPLVLKEGRSGLGRSSFLKEQEAERIAQKKQQEKQTLTDFIQWKQSSQVMARMERDLRNSQRACEQLDEKQGHLAPVMTWFWTDSTYTVEEEDTDSSDCDEELTIAEKLEMLTEYLRDSHLYCVWCGTSYENDQDMKMNCPGNTRELHDNV